MEKTILLISPWRLVLILIPVILVILIFYKWSLGYKNALYAVTRMLGQLLIIGYLLTYIFDSQNVVLIFGVLLVMVFASSWIALGTVKAIRRKLLLQTIYAALIGGGFILILITQGVLDLHPWYQPQYLIPLAGMIFANAMNSISLAAERFASEISRNGDYIKSRQAAFNAALIPIINSLFAVGLVSLPGMMTGQILSGVSPLLAVRYQIMVMCMIFGAGGMATFLFLHFAKDYVDDFLREKTL
ncbi:MAG: ABC transporter permease [Calditrichaeota bacterium]|nr:ABC transporter permease [Calditrichota bacterium]